ncbi:MULTISPECIES: HAD family hydrolase [Gracilibacillus]|uniref:HAD family hydrolase n=1 Tax=Gracilibacillus TaxID=74385 RepID=UPI000824E1BC|nr:MULTISPECIES: HAD family hydrolase [Gracilibacillus]
MTKTIIFDLDDTLLWDKKSVKTAFEKTCQLAAEKYDMDPEQLEKAVREQARTLYQGYETYEFTQMIGVNPFEALWGNFLDDHTYFKEMAAIVPDYRKQAWTNGLKQIGIDDETLGTYLAEQFPEKRKESPFVYEETYAVLKKLQPDYQLIMLTNGSPDLQNTKLTITPELRPYFDHIIISGDFGRGKPDPAIFKHVLEVAGVTNEEALMVGDNLMTDILGANRTGIKSVWINHEGKTAEDVKPTYEISRLEELLEVL